MCLEIARPVKGQLRLPVDVADQALLRGRAGLRQAGGASVLVGAPGADDGADHVAVAHGVRHGLEHERDDALAARVAVGAVVKAVAPAVGREEALGREQLVDGRAEDQVGSRHEGLVVVAFVSPIVPVRNRFKISVASFFSFFSYFLFLVALTAVASPL